jgi:hypothetical protein
LAEVLGADVSTIQGWESGRRALSAVNTGDFIRLGSRLTRLGAPPSTSRRLREAVEADLVLSIGVAAAGTWVDPRTHPLAAHVHRRSLTNLITWPLTGVLPPQLVEFRPRTRRSGPVAEHPSLATEATTRFFDHLVTTAERSIRPEDALLRRQAVYLLGFDRRPHIVDRLRQEWRRAGSGSVRENDVPALLVARSASVALASVGDTGQLHDFVAATSGTFAEVTNLNYWAYWIGELAGDRTTDDFMAADDPRQWVGVKLLRHLTVRLDIASPHLPLNLHSVHALVATRPALLTGWPCARASLAGALDRIASSDTLDRIGRDQVAGLRYALRIANR